MFKFGSKNNCISVPPHKKANYFPKLIHDGGELMPGMNIQNKFKVMICPPIKATQLKQSETVYGFFKNNIAKLVVNSHVCIFF